MSATDERFELHPALLGHVMARQAPDLAKAIAELAMNGIDGGAGTIAIAIDGRRVTVDDDGQGLPPDADEIRATFGTFGAPHVDDVPNLGEFRLGRGQAMSLGRVEYRSNDSRIATDFPRAPDRWTLEQGLPHRPGCLVTLVLDADPSDQTASNVRRLLRYLPGTVTLDGERINTPAPSRNWTYETDDAFVDVDGTSLAVYNKGVLVREYVGDRWGVCGTVVSKRKLKLTMGRNEVMDDCPVFLRIVDTIEESFVGVLAARRPGPLPSAIRRRALRLVATGKLDVAVLDPHPVLRDARGRWVGFRALLSLGRYCLAPTGHPVAHQATAEQGVVPLDRVALDDDDFDFQAVLRRASRHHGLPVPRLIPWEEVVAAARLGRKVMDTYDLPRRLQAVMFGLQTASAGVAALIERLGMSEGGKPVRRVLAATRDSVDDFTDGETFVALEMRLIEEIAGGRTSLQPAIAMIAKAYLGEPDPTDGSARGEGTDMLMALRQDSAMSDLWQARPYAPVEVSKQGLDGTWSRTATILVRDAGDLARQVAVDIGRKAISLHVRLPWVHGATAGGESEAGADPEDAGTDPLDEGHVRAQAAAVRALIDKALVRHGIRAELTEKGAKFMLTRRPDAQRPSKDQLHSLSYAITSHVGTGSATIGCANARPFRHTMTDAKDEVTAAKVATKRLRPAATIAFDLLGKTMVEIILEVGFHNASVEFYDPVANRTHRHERRQKQRGLFRGCGIRMDGDAQPVVRTFTHHPSTNHQVPMYVAQVRLVGWTRALAMVKRKQMAAAGAAHLLALTYQRTMRARPAVRDAPPEHGWQQTRSVRGLADYRRTVAAEALRHSRNANGSHAEEHPLPVRDDIVIECYEAGCDDRRAITRLAIAAGWRTNATGDWITPKNAPAYDALARIARAAGRAG